jgi:hypothetical protein
VIEGEGEGEGIVLCCAQWIARCICLNFVQNRPFEVILSALQGSATTVNLNAKHKK